MAFDQRRLSRLVVRSVVVITLVGALPIAIGLVIERILVRFPDKRLRAKVIKPFNKVILLVAGRRFSPTPLLTHTGRRSGRTFQTPLGAYPYRGGFALALAYGTDVDWYRNITASGHATLRRYGHDYALERPELISLKDAMSGVPLMLRPFVKTEAHGEQRQAVLMHRAPGE
jgi:deazaflavin-dependent oxidoreductase (nitroreductase family)